MSDSKPESTSAAENTEPEPESAQKEAPETVTAETKVDDELTQFSAADNEPEKPASQLEEKVDENVVASSSEPAKEAETKKLSEPESSEKNAASKTVDTPATERKQSSASEKEVTEERKKSKETEPSDEKQRKISKEADLSDEKQRKKSAEIEAVVETERKKSKEIEANDEKQRKVSKEVEVVVDSERKKSKEIEASDEKQRKTSKDVEPVDNSQRKQSKETESNDELQDMIKEIAESKTDAKSDKIDDKKRQQTTENLISVLEGDMEGQVKEKPSKTTSRPAKAAPPAATATGSGDAAAAIKPPKPKKYLYKLKSKTGKILHYTSTVPITLKRPIIHLTKMPDTSSKSDPVRKIIGAEMDVDSDNSTKENNVKENEAPNDNVIRVVKKKGRPPLSSRPPPPVITLDGNASDTGEDTRNKSSTSFSMQTRKRQLKFLPDGRLVTPQKRVKPDDKNESTSSSDSDIDIISDGEKAAEPAAANKAGTPKKSEITIASVTGAAVTTPAAPSSLSIASTSTGTIATQKKFKSGETIKTNSLTGERRKYKKVFDYESYYREKTGVSSQATVVRTPIGNKSFASNLTPIRKLGDTPKLKPILPANSATPKKSSSVDPAQLLSSLIGVPISSSQLNVVKFKPKVIQERANTIIASTPKKVTFQDDRNVKHVPAQQSELLKSTPFKIVSKPTYQKILPKPSSADKMPISRSRMAYQPLNFENHVTPSSNSLFVTQNSPFIRESLHDALAKFETFTDSKVVKTKEGPKRAVKRKQDEDVYLKDNNTKTLYDLMYEIFEKMPSWNLHVVPDTKCFCIAQVSRGRMGIPTLKKSIEINAEFFAKVYVHQLQCKRYDGIYDTESKIIKLIKEIDALAA
ncbi:WASH complex subunit 2-like [Planococcus citri]|uniref:WASH complex subunit 2-like n=1 Tax=Planococcus citri TaxID=170843 RepID=UPI0031F92FBB